MISIGTSETFGDVGVESEMRGNANVTQLGRSGGDYPAELRALLKLVIFLKTSLKHCSVFAPCSTFARDIGPVNGLESPAAAGRLVDGQSN